MGYANGLDMMDDDNVGTGKKMTNADRIRNMTDEELARWLVYVRATVQITGNRTIGSPAAKTILEWLKQEVEVSAE